MDLGRQGGRQQGQISENHRPGGSHPVTQSHLSQSSRRLGTEGFPHVRHCSQTLPDARIESMQPSSGHVMLTKWSYLDIKHDCIYTLQQMYSVYTHFPR